MTERINVRERQIDTQTKKQITKPWNHAFRPKVMLILWIIKDRFIRTLNWGNKFSHIWHLYLNNVKMMNLSSLQIIRKDYVNIDSWKRIILRAWGGVHFIQTLSLYFFFLFLEHFAGDEYVYLNILRCHRFEKLKYMQS